MLQAVRNDEEASIAKLARSENAFTILAPVDDAFDSFGQGLDPLFGLDVLSVRTHSL